MGKILTVTDANYKEIIDGAQLTILDFWAEWCGPCKMIAPLIDELAEDYDGRVVFGKVDVDANFDVAAEFGIRNIPTILFFKDGNIVDKQVGAAPKNTFVEKIDKLL